MSVNPRAVIGRSLLASAMVMIVLATLFWAGTIPIDPEARPLLAGMLALTAVIDALIALWFLRRSS